MAPDVSEETAAVIDRMLRPSPAERQASYQELISELESARTAALAREEELRGRWSWPLRVAVSLGALLLLGAIGFGVIFGLRHLPHHGGASSVAVETPVPDVATQAGPARRELRTGHYGSAEALLRELATSMPEVLPAADLAAALQL